MSDKELEQEVAQLIIEALNLEEVGVTEIDPDEPLFGEGLALDSLDALEIAMAIGKKYGVQIKAEDEASRPVFRNVKSLAAYVGQHRAA